MSRVPAVHSTEFTCGEWYCTEWHCTESYRTGFDRTRIELLDVPERVRDR